MSFPASGGSKKECGLCHSYSYMCVCVCVCVCVCARIFRHPVAPGPPHLVPELHRVTIEREKMV